MYLAHGLSTHSIKEEKVRGRYYLWLRLFLFWACWKLKEILK